MRKGSFSPRTLAKADAIKAFVAAGGTHTAAARKFKVWWKTVEKIAGPSVWRRPPPPRSDGPVMWTPKLVSALVQAWDKGMSMTEIARKLRVGKNQVAGKKHRLGLPNRGSPIPKRGKTKWVAKLFV